MARTWVTIQDFPEDLRIRMKIASVKLKKPMTELAEQIFREWLEKGGF